MNTKMIFSCFAKGTAKYTGSAFGFSTACVVVIVWAFTGPYFHYSDTWQLVINTGTTIVTFLMVFLIQATQNRDAHALQIKLDELIRATQGAHLGLIDLEELEEEDLVKLRDRYLSLAKKAHELKEGEDDCGTPELALI